MTVKVSVIMPVYNGADFLELTIPGILAQSYPNFELIILDDASTDASWEICRRFGSLDHRIRLLRNATNLGLITTLNKLLDEAQGEYIARQDHDDLSAVDRLEKQASFLDSHPEIGLLGTAFHQIDMQGNRILTTYQPETDVEIRWKILFANPFAHTSVMFRRSLIIEKGLQYSNEYPHSEDYELWIRMLKHTRAANLPEALVSWRRNITGVSQTHVADQGRNWRALTAMQMNRLIPGFVNEEEVATFFCLYTQQPLRPEEIRMLGKLPTLLHVFSAQMEAAHEKEGLRRIRQDMIDGVLECVINGLSSYRYFGNPNLYLLLCRLFLMDPARFTARLLHRLKSHIRKESKQDKT